MSKKIYLYLLFFCGVSFQGIFATLANKDNRSSSDLLVRKRRVINQQPGGSDAAEPETDNYVVKVRLNNEILCAGSILTQYIVITSASCTQIPSRRYKVYSGGAYDNVWDSHNVSTVIRNYGNLPHEAIDGISLMTVVTPFVFDRKTGNIQLYVGSLQPGTPITVFGWGHVYPQGTGSPARHRIRKVTVPILNQGECVNLYHHRYIISPKHICTVCAVQYCTREEIGGPLVINNRLAGVHTLKGPVPGQIHPDVYVNLQQPEYSAWVRGHIGQ